MGYSLWLAGALSGYAQSEQGEKVPPPVRMEDLQALIESGDGELAGLVKNFIGEENANRYFYFPTRDEPATPAKWGLKYEDVEFHSTDGTKLHGWFLPAKLAEPKGTVVFSHGNAGSIGHHLWFTVWMVEAGYNVMLYDYRGFGKSEGEVDRRGMIEDVKAAFDYIVQRPDVDASRLISYGHSLGGAKSITALAEKQQKVSAIIIEGTFTSYRAMAKVIGGELGGQLITDEFSPRDFISKITETPLLVVHGTLDQVVPITQGLEMFELANEPKTLFEVKEGMHGNSLSRDSGAYRKRVLNWLDQVMNAPARR
ncbi:alpha/beta hydrolase [Luteolibacter sp. AS25]|uniref:alpha/beta hydrolase n=1 Tax=Luteolibacter sp. AS25 TaxID=3135776 RepID=UPI00398A749B